MTTRQAPRERLGRTRLDREEGSPCIGVPAPGLCAAAPALGDAEREDGR
ncbi:UNVERIFIED_ORG: hypothetical protein FHR35_003748 [Microbispora rosea subsp. rosea]